MSVYQFANNGLSTLTAGINASATSLTVAAAASFSAAAQFPIQVDNEIMLVTGVAGATFTVTRAQEGTTAGSHPAGSVVRQILSQAALIGLLAARILGARVSLTATQSISNNSTTALSGFTVVRDDLGAYSGGSPTRLTVAATGWHACFAHVKWAAIATGKCVNDFRVNGSTFIGSVSLLPATLDPDMNYSTLSYFTAADYVELTCFQNSGGSINITAAEFSLLRLF